jgi:hypothetical protein
MKLETKIIGDNEDVICPFCDEVIKSAVTLDPFEICSHTFMVATDHGFEYVRDDYKGSINENQGTDLAKYITDLMVNGALVIHLSMKPNGNLFMTYWGFTS